VAGKYVQMKVMAIVAATNQRCQEPKPVESVPDTFKSIVMKISVALV
jgi:hypothetical protein